MGQTITKLELPSVIQAPRSKSYSNRALLRAAYLNKKTDIINISNSNDVKDLIHYLELLGHKIEQEGDVTSISPRLDSVDVLHFPASDGGTTTRFMMCLAASLDRECHFQLSHQLSKRPMDDLYRVLGSLGVNVEVQSDNIVIKGPIKRVNEITIDCSKTTQFASALKLVDVQVECLNLSSSTHYLKMTDEVIASLNQTYSVPTDFSSLSYPLLLAYMKEQKLFIQGVEFIDSLQGDSLFIDILGNENFSLTDAGLEYSPKKIDVFDVDCSNCLDLVPTLFAMALTLNGKSIFRNVQNLRNKESDRIASLVSLAKSFDVNIEFDGQNLAVTVEKVDMKSRILSIPYDHRIAMIASILLDYFGGGELDNLDSIDKSYPAFRKFIK
jgi:3-phosphoshikimate 1-carboxyvinyltransferase